MNPNCFLFFFFSKSYYYDVDFGSMRFFSNINIIVSCLQACSVVPSIEIYCSLLCPLEASPKKIPSLVKSYALVLVSFLFTFCKKKKRFLLVDIYSIDY